MLTKIEVLLFKKLVIHCFIVVYVEIRSSILSKQFQDASIGICQQVTI